MYAATPVLLEMENSMGNGGTLISSKLIMASFEPLC